MNSSGDPAKEHGSFIGVLKYIRQTLVEDSDEETYILQNSALQAVEKSFCDILTDNYTISLNQTPPNQDLQCQVSNYNQSSCITNNNLVQTSQNLNSADLQSKGGTEEALRVHQNGQQMIVNFEKNRMAAQVVETETQKRIRKRDHLHVAVTTDKDYAGCNNEDLQKEPKGVYFGKKWRRNRANEKELVDLRNRLIQCAEAVAGNDCRSAKDILMQIRQQSSPFGNGNQRLAHFFAKALEARLAGTGIEIYAALASTRIPISKLQNCRSSLTSACPFMEVSNFFVTQMIMEQAHKAARNRIHIIHFGIPYGLKWRFLIQSLSRALAGPPMLRITGLDLPKPGPASRIEETGHRLANYCKRFNVPFVYNAIREKWENIHLEDLKIERDEVVIVNCLYRLRHLVDETEELDSPRDSILNLMKKINPNVFIHGIVNGAYNAPFFISRFRETLYYYSAVFDMFEAIAGADDEGRTAVEEGIYGKEIVNVIACEGSERMERPETYKQWQVRNLRAGFSQLPLKQDMVKMVRRQVKLNYHRDFLVDEDNHWMLQGWKGRTLFALSCWKPARM